MKFRKLPHQGIERVPGRRKQNSNKIQKRIGQVSNARTKTQSVHMKRSVSFMRWQATQAGQSTREHGQKNTGQWKCQACETWTPHGHQHSKTLGKCRDAGTVVSVVFPGGNPAELQRNFPEMDEIYMV